MKSNHTVRALIANSVKKNKGLFLGMILIILGTIVTGILPPLVLEKAVNRLADHKDIPVKLALLYFGSLALAGAFESGKEIIITVVGQRMTHEMRTEMSGKLTRLPASYFVKNEAGSITARLVNDVDTLEALFTSGVVSMFVDVCSVISILVVIFTRSKGLTLLLLAVLPLLFWFTRDIQKRMKKAQLANRKAVGRSSKLIPETLHNLRTIHVMNKEAYMEETYGQTIDDSFKAMEESNFYDSIYSPIIIETSAVIVAVMMILSSKSGATRAMFGMSVGTAVAVISYVSRIFTPLESIGMEIQQIQSAAAGITRIEDFMNEEEQPVFNETRDASANPISLRHVNFGYEEEPNIIQDFSLEMPKGRMATLAGRTGSGKSTLFKLILGLYEPRDGEILLAGYHSGAIPQDKKRKILGYVPQQFQLIPGTVKDQITLGDDSVSDQQVHTALRITGLQDSVNALELKELTPCTKNTFSQGEFQLLSIARAVVNDPEILLLDEITANLDSLTEQRILKSLDEACKNRTVLSISHRLFAESGGDIIQIGEN